MTVVKTKDATLEFAAKHYSMGSVILRCITVAITTTKVGFYSASALLAMQIAVIAMGCLSVRHIPVFRLEE